MAVLQCENGHYYDGAAYASCPHCVFPPSEKGPSLSRDSLLFSLSGEKKPAVLPDTVEKPAKPTGQEEKTVAFYSGAKGMNPVVGWLVCVQGSDRGKDFKLYPGRNRIGRALSMDLVLTDDLEVARENHCVLIFDPKQMQYILMKGVGSQVVINGQSLLEPVKLLGDEKITIGSQTFIFIPFCREGRTW